MDKADASGWEALTTSVDRLWLELLQRLPEVVTALGLLLLGWLIAWLLRHATLRVLRLSAACSTASIRSASTLACWSHSRPLSWASPSAVCHWHSASEPAASWPTWWRRQH
jgi:hypothetical protein